MQRSVEVGQIVLDQGSQTLSDGTAGGVESDSITFEFCKRLVDSWELISEAEIAHAMNSVHEAHGMIIEGAAGVAVAGAFRLREQLKGKNVSVVLCGANIDPDLFASIVR